MKQALFPALVVILVNFGTRCAMIETPMRIIRLALFGLLAGIIVPAQTTSGWKLVWSDEFNGQAGTQPDPAKWNYDLGNNNGWGNAEAEIYTNSANNVFQDVMPMRHSPLRTCWWITLGSIRPLP